MLTALAANGPPKSAGLLFVLLPTSSSCPEEVAIIVVEHVLVQHIMRDWTNKKKHNMDIVDIPTIIRLVFIAVIRLLVVRTKRLVVWVGEDGLGLLLMLPQQLQQSHCCCMLLLLLLSVLVVR